MKSKEFIVFWLPVSAGVDVGHPTRRHVEMRHHDHSHNHTMRGANVIAIAVLCTAAKVAEASAGFGGNQPKASTNRRGRDTPIAGKKQQCTAARAAAISLGGGGSVGGGGADGKRRFDKQVTRGRNLQLC